jgi:hypothetical protein
MIWFGRGGLLPLLLLLLLYMASARTLVYIIT